MSQPRLYREAARAIDLHCASLNIPPLAQFKANEAEQFFAQQPHLNYQRPLPISHYQFNSSAFQELWQDAELTNATAILNKTLVLDAPARTIETLLPQGMPLRLMGFKNNWRSKQRDLLRFMLPGEWYLGTSHQNPKQRLITRQALQDPELSRALMNLSMDHVRHYVGVCDTSQRCGMAAIDAPRHYSTEFAAGHVNPKDHPALLWRLRFPKRVSAAEQRAYINNIRTWTLLLHKIVQFASVSNGSDVMHFTTLEAIQDVGKQVLETLQQRGRQAHGIVDASWVQNVEASLNLPLNLGLTVPLNQHTVTALYGQEAWFTVQRLVREGRRLWRAGRLPDVYEVGAHQYVQHSEQYRMIHLELAPDWLEPLQHELVLQPWTSEQLIMQFLEVLQPHWDTQNWQTCNEQADILTYLKPTLLNALGVKATHAAPPALVLLFDELVSTIRTRHDSYAALKQQLAPLFEQLQTIVKQEKLSEGWYMPAALIPALRHAPSEQVGLEIMGQLFHIDLLTELTPPSS